MYYNISIVLYVQTEKLLDSSIPFVERSRLFDEAVNNYLYDIKRKVDFNSINLVCIFDYKITYSY